MEGICGVYTNFWEDELKENGIKVNSLEACLYIYEKYFEETNSKRGALKLYKGIESKKNYWIIDKVIKIEKEIK